ncbi:MAG: YbhB/YbcL family Raf kinase inhibitor-like protein [Candidatus Omnitrophota bacterium]
MLQKILLNLGIIFLILGGAAMALEIESPAFKAGEFIPKKYTCEADDISPPLFWKDAPEGTKSFILINDDPDAPGGDWVHWLVYNIPVQVNRLEENMQKMHFMANAMQGLTSFGSVGYGGPCPPPGKPHRYFFKLYALDTVLGLKPGANKKSLLKAMQGHILAEAELVGLYKR